MNFIFKAKLAGLICPDCPEWLANVKVRLYRLRKDQTATALATAQPKDTFVLLSDDMVKRKASSLIAEAKTDDQGNVSFKLGDKQDYNGEAFEIDVYLESVPGRKPDTKKYPPVQFTITTLQPQWRDGQNALVAGWEYVIPQRFWCGIRAQFGAWVICGTVTACDSQLPVQGVKVRAFDVDWLQDDELGSALTNAAGKFRIDYSTEDFKQTPLSPWINWEMIGGPDLYFKIETPGGTSLLAEPRSRGRDKDRENAGPCFCVRFCLEKVPTDDTPSDHTYPLFNKVGQYRVNTDFTAAGLTDPDELAFTGTIPLRGILPDGSDPIKMEYRFLIGKYGAGGVLGAQVPVDATQIAPTIIGQLEFWNLGPTGWHIDSADYWLNNPAAPHNVNVQPGGWIAVPSEGNLGLPPAPGVGKFIPNSRLLNLITTELVDEFFDLTVAPEQKAGNAVPAGRKPAQTHTYKITFEAREVGTAVVSDSNALDKIVISNTRFKYNRHPHWAGQTVTLRSVVMLDIEQMVSSGNGCGKMNNDLNALFTVYHPFASSAQIYFEGNAPLPAAHSPAIINGEAISGGAGFHFDISALQPCAYILWLRLDVKLTHGWGLVSDYRIWDKIAFCKA